MRDKDEVLKSSLVGRKKRILLVAHFAGNCSAVG